LKSASNDAIFDAQQGRSSMRTTLTLDDELLAQAQEYSGVKEKSALVNQALKEMVQREAARRLARLGGTMPGAKAPPRRRFDPR
jgi:Arc/MetJ family transcription regulator